MEKNFHYHGTYTAAVLAGFSTDDALVIARAAQYVDDCSDITIQKTSTLFWANLLDTIPGRNREIQELLNIWPVFHFLPGNFLAIKDYVNPQLLASPKPHLCLAPLLICGTESAMTNVIVEGAKEYQAAAANHTQWLQRVGITMHVLADTYAHQGFAGIPLSLVNEVSHVRQAISGGDLHMKPHIYVPAGASRSSFGYLGHGRIGYMPDWPGATFTYQAAWQKETDDVFRSRYNPLEFYCAYLQMKEAMEFILDNRHDFPNRIERAPLLNDKPGGQWPTVYPFLKALEDAGTDEGFPDHWYTVVSTVQRPRDYAPYDLQGESALYQSFVTAANDHRDLVKQFCAPLNNYLALFT